MDKIAHKELCKIFRPQNCWLVLICTTFRAQNHSLVLMAPCGFVYFFKKFQTWIKNWQRTPDFQSRLPITCFLLRLAHNFSFGVDFTPFATQNNGTFWLAFSFTIVFTCHGQLWLTLSLLIISLCHRWRILVFHVNLLVLSCHVLFTATVIFCQDGILK